MASDGNPVSLSVTSLLPAAHAGTAASQAAGKALPQRGSTTPSLSTVLATSSSSASSVKVSVASTGTSTAAKTSQATNAARSNASTLVAQLNKYLNDSGRPDQYRVDPNASTMIQEVNPANGVVLAQFSASEFPALARSVGASGLLFDSLA